MSSGGLGSRTTTPKLTVDEAHKRFGTSNDAELVLALLGGCVRAEEALRQALRYCESYCEATDPDPRDDDGEEMSTASAYVLSAMLAIAEGLAGVDKPA